jgi:hypothetical protein
MTNQFGTKPEAGKTFYSPTTTISMPLAKPSSMLMELSTEGKAPEKVRQRGKNPEGMKLNPRRKFAESTTVQEDADLLKMSAITSISARDVDRQDMGSPPALGRSISEATHGMKPKYLRYIIWDPDSDFTPNTADWTKIAEPLEGPLIH